MDLILYRKQHWECAKMRLVYEKIIFGRPHECVNCWKYFKKKWCKSNLSNMHEEIEIIYVYRGNCTVIINTEPVDLREGEAAVISSNSSHNINTQESECGYYYLIVSNKFCDSIDVDVSNIEFQNPIKDKAFIEILLNLINESDKKPPYFSTAVKAYLSALMLNLCRYHLKADVKVKTEMPDRNVTLTIRNVLHYIAENCEKPLTLDMIRKNTGYSKYHFCRLFKEVTGQTVMDYLRFARCFNAKTMLASGQYSVSEAAERCGFINSSYFTKMYKKYFGITPSETRRQIKNKIINAEHL